MRSQALILRADASIAIGTGHMMRCLALAQAWQDSGGVCVFVMADSTSAIAARLKAEYMELISVRASRNPLQELKAVAEIARHYSAKWVVIDGYQFDSEYQRALSRAGVKVLCIDDSGTVEHYSSDIVLNQNLHASRALYRSREARTRLLLGPRYALLRREFSASRSFKREIPPRAHKVLVTMGGSDPDNVTLRIIEALNLSKSGDLQVTIVVGGSNPHFSSLQHATKSFPGMRLLRDAPNMLQFMTWADVAISAAGTTCWEMCLVGLPAILIDLAENQRPVAEELHRQQIAIHAGSTATVDPSRIVGQLTALLDSPERRGDMSRRGQLLVDGRGAERVIRSMRGVELRLRRVEERDCKLLWEWSNDPSVRKVSFSTDFIPWKRHLEWFRSKLDNKNVVHYLVINKSDLPVGQVRFELDGPSAVMSLSLASEFRGAGYGSSIMAMTTDELFRSTDVKIIHAYVKLDNEASLKLFATAGFSQEATVAIQGREAVHFVLERTDQA